MKTNNLTLPSGTLAYLESKGKPGAPVIIALHGWLDNAASFVPLQKVVPEYRWIIPDLPGHGDSDHRPEASHYHFIDWVEDLVDFIDALSLSEPPILIGHSLGGMLSTVIAGVFPDKIAKLVLIDAAGLVTQNSDSLVSDMREAFDSRRALKQKSKRTHKLLESAIKAREAAGNISYDAAKTLTLRNIKTVEGGFEWKTDIRLRAGSPLRLSEQAASQVISAIQAPTLILLAKDGYQNIKDNYAKFAKYYANHVFVEVPGHHHCHMEFPDSIAEQLGKFLL